MSLTKNIVKGRTYLAVNKAINKRTNRFEEEKKYLIDTYNLEEDVVNNEMQNLRRNKPLDFEPVNEDNSYLPDYYYEKEMTDSLEEFKTELIYDGMFELANSIRLPHFFHLFSPYYNPYF